MLERIAEAARRGLALGDPPDWRVRAFAKSLFAGPLALLAATWRLWTPQQAFPQVPLVGWALPAATELEWLLLGALTTSLLAGLLGEGERLERILTGTAAAAMLGLILIDQLRLQAWAWQFVLIAGAWSLLDRREAWTWLRLLTISLYAYSAIAKLNPEFAQTLGPRLVGAGLQFVGLQSSEWPGAVQTALAWSLPLGELLIAGALAWPRTRRWGALAAVAMHAALIAVLCPWGLNHSAGVLTWNVVSIVQVVLLFGMTDALSAEAVRPPPSFWLARAGSAAASALRAVLLAALALPALEAWGWCDAWPAWGLYSARNERTEVYLSAEDAARVRGPARRFVSEQPDAAGRHRLRLDAWCLDALGVPIYPQHREDLGVVQATIETFQLADVEVTLVGSASHFHGARSREEIPGGQIAESGGRYWWNIAPRANLAR